jgi:hypothetical protein
MFKINRLVHRPQENVANYNSKLRQMNAGLRAATTMDPLDRISSAKERKIVEKLAKKSEAMGAPDFSLVEAVFSYMSNNGGVSVGKGAAGEAWSLPASAVPGLMKLAGVEHPAPVRAAPLPSPSTRVVVKIAPSYGELGKVLQGYHEMRVHAYLADPSIKTPGLPRSSDHVPKYHTGGYSPKMDATLTVMELVDGRQVAATRELSARAFADLEKAFVSLWARRILHADAHSGNAFVKKDGRVALIDFGASIVLPESLRAKTVAQATSVEYYKKLDEFCFMYSEEYTALKPNTRALRDFRRKVPNSNAALNAEIKRTWGGNAKISPKPPSGARKPSPMVTSARKPSPMVMNARKPSPMAMSSRKPSPMVMNARKPSPSRVYPAPSPLLAKKKTELLEIARAMKRDGYNLGTGYGILLKSDLAKRIENAKRKGKLASVELKKVKNLKANAKTLGIKGAYAMKRENLVSAMRNKKV